MDKILLALAALGIVVGALFLPRSTRAASDELTGIDLDKLPPGGRLPDIPPAGSSPLGIRNNNPFNLEFHASIQWRGQIGTDGRFAVFDTALNGLRAGMINVHTKFTRDGLNTVRKLLNRLSPSFENPTENFINFVSQRLNVAPDQPLVFGQVIIPLSQAIVTFENAGNPYPDSLYREALRESGRT